MFNKFGDNEDKAMKYFLAKTTFIRWWALSVWSKMLINNVSDFLTWRIQSLDDFEKKYAEIKKQFIDDLVQGESNFDEKEKKVIFSLQNRLDYYYAKYKRQHYWI
jgi:recombinational DNA repair ATPase RecF